MNSISYNEPGQASYASVSVATTGTDVVTITDGAQLKKSQLSVMVTCDLSSATAVAFDFLYSPDQGTTWIATPIIATATGIATNLPVKITTASFLVATNIYGAMIDVPQSGATQFKIKGTATGAASAVKMWVFTRDN